MTGSVGPFVGLPSIISQQSPKCGHCGYFSCTVFAPSLFCEENEVNNYKGVYKMN